MIRGARSGADDTVRIADLNFDDGDVLRLTNFANGTFVRPEGARDLKVQSGGSRVTIESVEGLLQFGKMRNVAVSQITDGGDAGYAFRIDLGAAGALTLRILQNPAAATAPETDRGSGSSGGGLYIAPWDRDDVVLREDTIRFLREDVAPTPSSTAERDAIVKDLLSLRGEIDLWPGLDAGGRPIYNIDIDRDGVIDRTLDLLIPQDGWQ
jgi:hypothetical protein